MGLEGRLSAREIVMNVGMSTRPEFYSGRGAIIDDLTDGKLERIYVFIEREYGKDTSQEFAQMVADIPVLSATDFLLSLYRLEAYEWKWDKSILGNEKGKYAGDVCSAFGTVMSVLSSSGRNETEYIRQRFLERHGIKTEKPRSIFDPVMEEY